MSGVKKWPSYQSLAELVALLNASLEGGRIQKVRDPDSRTIALKIRIPGRSIFLTFSGDPEHGRVEVTESQPPTLPQPTGVGRWVRAHLEGARVEAITLHPDDRVVTLTTLRGSLCLELLPQAPNLYTISEDGRVMGWSKRIPSRGLRLGQPWSPPERPDDLILKRPEQTTTTSLTREEALTQLSQRIGKDLSSTQKEEHGPREGVVCRRLLKQTRARLERLSTALYSDIERADHAQAWSEEGELLKSHLGELKRGMGEIVVTDWYHPDLAQRVITLDPKLDGIENIERRFQKHRKAVKGAEIAAGRLEEVEAQLHALSDLEQDYSEGPIEALRSALLELGVYRAKQQPRRDLHTERRLPYRIFWSAQGETIWLGRGGVDNHLTSFQAARGQDLWVHTRDVPGAHVIIPLPRRGHEPHPETILDAAALAVHHSKQRGEEHVELYFTERKHIRPVPGGPPGKVMVSTSKTLIALDVELRIARLYEEEKRRSALKRES